MAPRRALALAALIFMSACLLPQMALADGPITPSATDYLARVTHSPPGLQVKPVDGYVNLWAQAAPATTVVIEDFRGAPYLRFSPAGVYVNHNSEEYYLNQVPVPAVPPRGLTRTTAPDWVKVSSGRAYRWREGRLHALATIQLQPGQTYVGRWSIPVTVNGARGFIDGEIFHRPAPSVVWFWPILVMLLCALAAWRLRDPEIDRKLAKGLTLTLMGLFVIAMASRQLHGRPSVVVGQLIVLAVIVVIVGAGALRELRRPIPSVVMVFATALVAAWAGVTLLPVLTHGYVLVAFPPFIVRCVTAALLGGSLSLALIWVRLLGGLAVPQDEPPPAAAVTA